MTTNSPNYRQQELLALGFGAIGERVQIAKTCALFGIEHIYLGDNVRIDAFTTITASESHPVHIKGFNHIGGCCYMSGYGGGIVLEQYTTLASGVHLYSSSDDYSGAAMTNPTVPSRYTRDIRGLIRIKTFAILGAHAVVLPSCVIEEGVALGALSLANKSLEAWTIYGGVPAKPLKKRERKPLALRKQLESDPHYAHLFGSSIPSS